MLSRGKLSVIACDSGRPFAERVVAELKRIMVQERKSADFGLTPTTEVVFPVGEVKTVIEENIRGHDVYVIQLICDPQSSRSVNDNFMALCTAINAAYASDAEVVTAVIPQYPYARQDRRKTREGITAKQVAQFLEASGANRVITMDIHSEQIQGFFCRSQLENVHAGRPLIDFFVNRIKPQRLVVVSPDVGSANKARYYSKALCAELAVVDKARDYSRPSTIESMRLVGNVEGCDVFIGDDMIDTGSTLLNAVALLKEKGAGKIYLACSHPIFSRDAVARFDRAHQDGLIEMVIGTDAVFRGAQFAQDHPWYHEASVAPLFAKVIYNINQKRSVSQLLL